jgi:hypothetical protein
VNADNASSNDTQIAALTLMGNTFEEVNRARCFNHTLQLSVKTLLQPFNVGMSSMKASEEEETDNFNNEMGTLLDKDPVSDDETDDDDGGYGYSDNTEDLDGGDRADNADSDETDELSQLDEEERENILSDTAVVRQTITKVCSDPF